MDKFLPQEDELGKTIQNAASDLYRRLKQVNADELGLPAHCLYYYKASHSKRLFFSIETSAHLLYNSIRLTGKSLSDIILMDYGAGVGTLYLLAKLVGCKKVVYNDHLIDWKDSAKLIAEAVAIQIDEYIIGDIKESLVRLDELNIQCDLITSRNVVEHIYKLEEFYNTVHQYQPEAIIYSSTTANKKNPAAELKHILWHHKWEKIYRGQRFNIIQRQASDLSGNQAKELSFLTRGLASADLESAINSYIRTGEKPNPSPFASNTCDPSNGVWAEHLLSTAQYRKLINERFFNVSFAAGFWDTHYNNKIMCLVGKVLNKVIAQGGKLAMAVAPFIYVIAIPASRK